MYTQAGFRMATSGSRLAGVALLLVAAKNVCLNEKTIKILTDMEKDIKVLTEAVAQAEANATVVIMSEVVALIRADYSSLCLAAKAHKNDPDPDVKAAANKLLANLQNVTAVFANGCHETITAMNAVVITLRKLNKKVFELLAIKGIFSRMCEYVDKYSDDFSEVVKVTAEARKETPLETAKEAIKKRFKLLYSHLDTVQLDEDDVHEDEFVRQAVTIWKKARVAQDQHKAAQDRAKAEKKKLDEESKLAQQQAKEAEKAAKGNK